MWFEDLSEYAYHGATQRPGTKNVGWLGAGHEFERAEPTDEFLELVWGFCKVSVAEMRGFHTCEFCDRDVFSPICRWKEESLHLGIAEMRIFSSNEEIYAAPNLIYHYISEHFYKPPKEFILAVHEGPKPYSQEYFEKLEKLEIEWKKTPPPMSSTPRRITLTGPKTR